LLGVEGPEFESWFGQLSTEQVQYKISWADMAKDSPFVLKVPLNTN